MRVVSIAITCDPCLAWKGLTVSEGVETVPVVGEHTLDLCREHLDGMRAVLDLIGEYADGAAIDRPATANLDRRTRREVERAVEAAERPRNRRGGRRARARRENAEERAEAAVVEGTAVELTLLCPLCGREGPTSASVTAHLREEHGTTAEAVYGLSCPVCGHEAALSRTLGAHGRREHGVTSGVPGLFALATREGDPLGIVAARAASLAEAAGDA